MGRDSVGLAGEVLDAEELVALEKALLAAASSGDQLAQMRLYRRASAHYLALADVDQACFFATNAWVIALALGDESERQLHQFLADNGRVPAVGG